MQGLDATCSLMRQWHSLHALHLREGLFFFLVNSSSLFLDSIFFHSYDYSSEACKAEIMHQIYR